MVVSASAIPCPFALLENSPGAARRTLKLPVRVVLSELVTTIVATPSGRFEGIRKLICRFETKKSAAEMLLTVTLTPPSLDGSGNTLAAYDWLFWVTNVPKAAPIESGDKALSPEASKLAALTTVTAT